MAGFSIDPSLLPKFMPSAEAAPDDKSKPSALRAGLGAGIHQLLGLGGSALQGVGTLTDAAPVAEAGKDFAATQNRIAERVGRPDLDVAPWQQGGAGVAPWLTYQAAKLVPTLAGYTAATVLTPEAAIPAGLARLGAAAPEFLGGGALEAGAGFGARRAALETGQKLGKFVVGGGAFGGTTGFGQAIASADQKPGGVTASDAWQAAAESPLYAAAGLVGPGFLRGALKGAEGKLVTRVLGHGLAGSVVGGVQAGVLAGLDQTFRPDLSTSDKMSNIVDATLTGGAVGGAIGAATGVRGLKRTNPTAIDTDTLSSVIDQELNLGDASQAQNLGRVALPAPTMFADSAGRTVFGSGGDAELRATPRDPAAPIEIPQADPALPSPGDIEGRSAVPGSTIVVGRRGERGQFTSEATGVEQPPVVPDDTSRAFRNFTDNELSAASNALANKREAQGKLSTSQEQVASGIDAELAFRRQADERNGALTNPVVSSAAEAVDRSANRKGAGTQDSADPASPSNDNIASHVTELTQGLRLPTTLKEKLANARSTDEVNSIIHDEVIVEGKGGKMRDQLAQRAGLLDGEGRPTPMVDEISARKTEPGEQAPTPAADAMFALKWKDDVKAAGQKDPAVRALAPTSEADAKLQLYRALGEQGVKSDKDGLERLAQKYGVLDDNMQLTPEALDLAKRDPIPADDAKKVAAAQGFKGAELSHFDQGVRAATGEAAPITKFNSTRQGEAYQAGVKFAEETNSVPKGALKKYAPGPQLVGKVTDADVARIDGTAKPPQARVVPEEVKPGQTLNRAVDATRDAFGTRDDDVAQLKNMVRSGDVEGAMEGLQRVQRGERLFQQPERQPTGPFKGEKPVRGAPKVARTADLVPTKGASRAEAERAIRRYQLTDAIERAHKEGALDSRTRLSLVAKLREGKYVDVRKAIPDGYLQDRVPAPGELQERAAQRQAMREHFLDLAEQASRDGEVPELQPDENGVLRYKTGEVAHAGTPAEHIRDAVYQAIHGWKSDGDVVVVDHADELPEHLRKAIHDDGAEDAKGFVHKGETYLIGENIRDPEEAVATLYHEALGHLGLEKLFHNKLDRKMVEMYRSNERLRTLVDAWRATNPTAYKGDLARSVEEVLAEMSEKGRAEAGIVSKLAAVFKEFGRRLGMKLEYSDREVNALLAMAHDQVINGRGEMSSNGMKYMLQLWHGSPHDFDKFTTTKMGSGEGAQVYGWGLYFAGEKGVAEHYRNGLSAAEPAKVDGRDPHEWVKDNQPLDADGKPLLDSDTLDRISRQAQHMAIGSSYWRDLRDEYNADWHDARRAGREYMDAVHDGKASKDPFLEQRLERRILETRAAIDMMDKLSDAKPEAKSRGKLYNVTVKQRDETFLNWDKPLNEQSAHVQKALAKLGFETASPEVVARLKAAKVAAAREQNEAIIDYQRHANARTTRTVDGTFAIDRLNKANDRFGEAARAYAKSSGEITGAQIYKALTNRFDDSGDSGISLRKYWKLLHNQGKMTPPQQASRLLRDAGIAGNKYADGFSRDGSSSTHNYVVFHDDDIEIAAKYKRPDELVADTQRTVGSMVSKVDEKVDLEGKRGAIRRGQLYATTMHHIAEYYGKWFDHTRPDGAKVNGLRQREATTDFREAIQQHLAQITQDPIDNFYALAHGDVGAKASYKSLNWLMQLSQYGIHPAREWGLQVKAVRDNPNLKPLVERANKEYRSLLTKGHAGIYDGMRMNNDIHMLAQTAMVLHADVATDKVAQGRIAEFAQNPFHEYMDAHAREGFDLQKSHDFWTRKLDTQVEAIKAFAKTLEQSPQDQLSAVDRRELRSGVKMMHEQIENVAAIRDRLDKVPYFHLGRDGDYFVSMKLRLGEDGNVDPAALAAAAHRLEKFGRVITPESGKDRIYIRTDSTVAQAELRRAAEALQSEGIIRPDVVDKTTNATTASVLSGKRTDDQIRNAFAGRWMKRVESEIKANDKLTDEDKARLISSFKSQAMDLMPDNSLAKVLAHREDVPGFDPDMLRSYQSRIKTGADALAGMAVASDLTDAYGNMRSAIRAAQGADLKDVPTAQRNGMTEIVDEISKHDNEHANLPKGSKALNQLQAFSGMFFLGANLAYPTVNLVQVPMMALPELGARHGYLKAARAFAKATPEALKIINAIRQQGMKVGLSRAADAVLTTTAMRKAGSSAKTVEYLMQVAIRGGIDMGGPSMELSRNARGLRGNKVDQTLRMASALGYYSETLSRLVVALAAHQLHPEGMTVEQKAMDTVRTLKESMWDYSYVNRSRMLGRNGFMGKLTPLATQFMQYTAMLNEKLYREVHEAIKGDTPEQRAEARRFLAGHLAMTTVFAGTLGLPFASVFAATYDRLKDMFDAGDEPSDIQASFRNGLAGMFGKSAAEVIARGTPRAAGIDLSTRVGEQDILPFSKFIADRRDLKDSLKDLEGRAWGAPTSMMLNMATGAQRLSQGDLVGGFHQMLPLGLSSMLKAYQMSDQGYTDSKGNVLPMTPSTRDILAQAVGFNPSQNAEYNEARGDQMQRQGLLQRQSAQLRSQIVSALSPGGDREKARELVARALELDRANPAFGVMRGIEGAIERRKQSQVLSERFGTPLGLNPKDIQAPPLTRYANVDYRAQ